MNNSSNAKEINKVVDLLIGRVERRRKVLLKRNSPIFGFNESHDFLKGFCKGEGLNICAGDISIGGSVGVDISLTLGAVLGLAFVSGDELTVVDTETQDYVISNYLEVFPDTLKVLNEWYRVLKPGGVLAFVVMNTDDYPDGTLGPLQNKNRVVCFTESTIKCFLTKAGFKRIKLVEKRFKVLHLVTYKDD